MPLILMHSPKGGVGTTFLTAHLAMRLAERGHQVTAIDFTHQDSLKLHFNMLPSQQLTGMHFGADETMVVHGVEVMNGFAIAQEGEFLDMLARPDKLVFDPLRITLVDVPSGALQLKSLLLARCDLHICSLLPFPASLATLTQVEPGVPTAQLEKTGFVLNQLDDTRRLSRHSHSFIRQLMGDALLGTVHRDEAVNEALAMFEPIAKFAPSSIVRVDLDRLTDTVETRLGIGRVHAPADINAVTPA